MASDDAKICYQNTIFANGFWQNAESNESLSESDAKAMLAEFRAVEIQARVVAVPLSGTYLDATEPLPLSSPCNSRDPISISACPVEIA